MPRSLIVLAFAALGLMAGAVRSQDSCVDCHTVKDDELAARGELRSAHLEYFRDSAHYREGVGCQDCHGGDSSSFDKWRAHRGMLNNRHPQSKTHPSRLPLTCGRCHGPIFAAYSQDAHWKLLAAGDSRAPGCTTCHVDMASQLLVRAQPGCAECHADDSMPAAKPLAGRGSELLGRAQAVRELRDKVENRIRKVRDDARRHELEEAFFSADSLLQQASESGHGFRWDEWEELIGRSQAAFDALLGAAKKR